MGIIRHSAGLILPLALAACGEPSTSGGLASPVPAARIHALSAVSGDSQPDLKALVEQLDADDPAVRLAAITRLERATGETFGCRYYDDARTRAAAVQQWVDAIEGETVMVLAQGANDE